MGEIIEYSGKHKRQKETLAEPGNHDLPRHRNVGKLDLQDMQTVGAVLGLTKERKNELCDQNVADRKQFSEEAPRSVGLVKATAYGKRYHTC